MSDQEVFVVLIMATISLLTTVIMWGIHITFSHLFTESKQEEFKPVTAIYEHIGGRWVKCWQNTDGSPIETKTGVRKYINGEWVTEWSKPK